MAAAEKNIHVSEQVLAQLSANAAVEGRTVDELAEESLREALREKSWQSLLARGLRYGEASGISDDDVSDVIRQYRKERRGR